MEQNPGEDLKFLSEEEGAHYARKAGFEVDGGGSYLRAHRTDMPGTSFRMDPDGAGKFFWKRM